MYSLRKIAVVCAVSLATLAACAPPLPEIGARPGTINFGRVVVGTSAMTTFELFTTRAAPFTIGYARANLTGTGSAAFSLAPPTARTAPLNSTTPITVAITCAPTSTGLHEATFAPFHTGNPTTTTNLPLKVDCQGVGNIENQTGTVRMSTGLAGTDAIKFMNLQAAGSSFDTASIEVKNTGAAAIEFQVALVVAVTTPADISVARPRRPSVTVGANGTSTVDLRFSPTVPGTHGATFRIRWRLKGPPAGPWSNHYFYAEGLAE